MIFWLALSSVTLLVIANLLNEILGELRLAKKDREDTRSQGSNDG